MATQKERANYFKELYQVYSDEFSEISEVGEAPMSELDFCEELKNTIKENMGDFD